MNSLLTKKLLRLYVFVFLFMVGCSGPNHASPTPSISLIITPDTINTSTAPAPTSAPPTVAVEITQTPTNPPTENSAISVYDSASFIDENYPDNSILKPGEKFDKTWHVKNIGTTTWTTAYTLVLNTTHQGSTLASAPQINLPSETAPGTTVGLSVSLVAPTTPGTYTVFWSLRNQSGEIIPVDGSNNIWVKIIVCDPDQPCNPPATGGGATTGGITATLTNFASDSSGAVASFCMNLPTRNYGPGGGAVSLIMDQNKVLADSGGSLSNPGCYEFNFSVSTTVVQQAKHISLSIDNVRILGGATDTDCESGRTTLKQKYPGLDFQCAIGSGNYYTNLQLPAGITTAQVDQLIVDAVEHAIYGPWVLTIQ